MNPDPPILIRAAQWLLGLDQIRLGRDAPIYLQWHSPFPGWFVLALSLLLVLLIIVAYWREQPRTGRRVVLVGLRIALTGLILAVICRPVLVLQRNRVSPSHVALLIDTSASMSQADHGITAPSEPTSRPEDAPLDAEGGHGATTQAAGALLEPAFSRLDQVRHALAANKAEAVHRLIQRNQLRVHDFAGQARTLATVTRPAQIEPLLAELGRLTADGSSTNLARGLESVLGERSADGGRLAAVVLASDGRSTEPAPLAGVLARAKAQQVPVYPLLVGSPTPARDVAVQSVWADDMVYPQDILAVRVSLEASGMTSPTPVTVQLVDEGSGQTLAGETVEFSESQAAQTVELRAKPVRSGARRFRVAIVPPEGDVNAQNDSDTVEVWVNDRPARVLYVEQMPRFEYRYLKNALVREDTVRCSILLLAADAQFAQEGTEPIRRFPETPEELERYDVILFGDVDPTADWLTRAQAQMIVDFVGQRGGGFGLIAGERNAPHRFRGSLLEKLLPVRLDPNFLGRYAENLSVPFLPLLTPEGNRSRLFRFDAGGGDPQGLISALPGWFWFARTLGPKPGAELWLVHPTEQAGDGPMPLVVSGHYGAGRVLFHGSDDTWRWRRGAGELVYDGYWIQVVRTLMPAHRADAGRRLVIRPQKRRYPYGQRVGVHVQVHDPNFLSVFEDRLRLIVRDGDDQPVARFEAQRLSGSSALFEGSFIPPRPGVFTITVQDPLALDTPDPAVPAVSEVPTPPAPSAEPPVPGAAGPSREVSVPTVILDTRGPERPSVSRTIRVDDANLEFRRREADHETLKTIAEATGGEPVPLERLADVAAGLRDRSVRIPDDVAEPLWDSRLAFILFASLITAEWILRKAYGMI